MATTDSDEWRKAIADAADFRAGERLHDLAERRTPKLLDLLQGELGPPDETTRYRKDVRAKETLQ